MAQNIDLVPGPMIDDVLYAQDKHISQAIWKNPTDEKVKRVKNFNHVPIINHPGVLYYIYRAGFYGLYHLMFVKIDNPLITALVERWRPETHTFHLSVGECTITLQDVEVLAGVRVDGLPVIRSEADSSDMVRKGWINELLGPPGPDTFQKDGMLSVRWLEKHFDPQDLAEDAPDDMVRRVARACILRILGSQFLQDKQGTSVQLYYLPFLIDFDRCGQYSWGSAILAFLYRCLCKAASGKSEQINGALILLQFWAWSRFTQIRPNDTLPAEEEPYSNRPRYPYGRRWAACTIKDNKGGSGHSLRVYRDQFDQMRDDQMIWEPYEGEMPNLPADCTAGQAIWLARVPLICIDIVEWHLPDRVMRQFGMRQEVPQAAIRNDKLHELSRKGNPKCDWMRRHANYIALWDARLQHVQTGQVHNGHQTISSEYMAWYHKITRRWIGPIIARPPPRGIQPTAGRMEVLYRALCRNYQLFMQHGINDGIQDCLQVFATLGAFPPDVEQAGEPPDHDVPPHSKESPQHNVSHHPEVPHPPDPPHQRS